LATFRQHECVRGGVRGGVNGGVNGGVRGGVNGGVKARRGCGKRLPGSKDFKGGLTQRRYDATEGSAS